MFAFKLWSRFGAFRDPITITQNVTLSIPPKTTIGGMLAAILSMDYNEYFENQQFFDFRYSLVLHNPIRKQSFSQNYIEDYTVKSHLKQDAILKIMKKSKLLEDYKTKIINQTQLNTFDDIGDHNSREDQKLKKKQDDYQKELIRFNERMNAKMSKPKPIRRELLINPSYLIFIKDFAFESEIIEKLQSHKTGFALYMGNSEFSANYEFVKCNHYKKQQFSQVNSFTKAQENIKFESGKKYTTIYAATKTVKGRKYRDFKKVTISDKDISFENPIDGIMVQTNGGEYNCEFI